MSGTLSRTTLSKAPRESTPGGTSRCICRRLLHDTKEVIKNGLRLVRLRFQLPCRELPDLKVEDLDKYLLFLLGTDRSPTPFPRAHRGWDPLGFPLLHRLGRRQRWELAHSCASIKRSLVLDSCPKHPPPSSKASWFARATTDSPPTSSPEYLAFARKIAREVFQIGWDRKVYPSFCYSYTARASARACMMQADEWWAANSSYEEFLAITIAGSARPDISDGWTLRFKEIKTAGKCRPLGIPTTMWDRLGPLHKAMYEHMARKSWLLRGPPTERRIREVCVHEHQVSIDLVNATDGLCLDVADALLGVCLSKSRSVPGNIKVAAHSSLRPSVSDGKSLREVTHGQMMGTYLSFPLLCLQSYVAARWATRNTEASYLVNGDDTLISSVDPIGDYPSGFQINRRKTIYSRNVAEINSTAFLRSGSGWRMVSHLRRGGYPNTPEGVVHAAAVCRKAGPLWIDAFCRSQRGSKLLFKPEHLGLAECRNLSVYQLSLRRAVKTGYYRKVDTSAEMSDRYVTTDQEPSEEEKIAFRRDLFNKGRDRCLPFKWPADHLQSTYRFGFVRPRSFWKVCGYNPFAFPRKKEVRFKWLLLNDGTEYSRSEYTRKKEGDDFWIVYRDPY